MSYYLHHQRWTEIMFSPICLSVSRKSYGQIRMKLGGWVWVCDTDEFIQFWLRSGSANENFKMDSSPLRCQSDADIRASTIRRPCIFETNKMRPVSTSAALCFTYSWSFFFVGAKRNSHESRSSKTADDEAARTFPAELAQLIEEKGYVQKQVFNADTIGQSWGKEKCLWGLSSQGERGQHRDSRLRSTGYLLFSVATPKGTAWWNPWCCIVPLTHMLSRAKTNKLCLYFGASTERRG